MADINDIDVVVFDVLGTLVDETGGIRTEIRRALPAADEGTLDDLLALWQQHVETEQQRIGRAERAYANSEVIAAEAAQLVAERADLVDPAATGQLATAGRRLPAWPDTVSGLDRLASRFAVVGLSNASRTAMLWYSAHAGLRWTHALSGEAAQAYKPAPSVYQLAIDASGCPPERLLMVAAHAWDLRGAQAAGMRTAYVDRPFADPPAVTDAFDGRFDGLDQLIAALSDRG